MLITSFVTYDAAPSVTRYHSMAHNNEYNRTPVNVWGGNNTVYYIKNTGVKMLSSQNKNILWELTLLYFSWILPFWFQITYIAELLPCNLKLAPHIIYNWKLYF